MQIIDTTIITYAVRHIAYVYYFQKIHRTYCMKKKLINLKLNSKNSITNNNNNNHKLR